MFQFLSKGSAFKNISGTKNAFDITLLIKDILAELEVIPDNDDCCITNNHLFLSKGILGKGSINLKQVIIDIISTLNLTIVETDCCNPKYNIAKTIISDRKHKGYLSLKDEIKKVLDFYDIPFGDECCEDFEVL